MTTQPINTPGPWVVRSSSNPNNGSDWRDIVSIAPGHLFSPVYVGEAMEFDAALIAAAPETAAERDHLRQVNALLVETLKQVDTWLSSGIKFIGPQGEETAKYPSQWIAAAIARAAGA